jgi:hypothetical protein
VGWMSNNFGFIKLWRKLQNNPLWEERREYSKAEAWIDILMTVRYDDAPTTTIIGMKVYTINAGESIKSLSTWAKRWGWSVSKVRRFLDLLQSMNMIRIKIDTKTTRLTVCNYCEYRDARNDNELITKLKRNTIETQSKTEREVPTNTVGTEKEEKYIYGRYVMLTREEYRGLCEIHGDSTTADEAIASMNDYAEQIGVAEFRKKYKSHFATLKNWKRRDDKRKAEQPSARKDRYGEERPNFGDGADFPTDFE